MSNNTINNAFTGGITQTQLQKTSSAADPAKTRETSAANRTGDAAVISNASSALAEAMKTDDARTEKVAAIKAAIENGTYNVEPTAVADKLIDTLLK
ncbi:MAG: flagellar biosynthesis anti-sigma factor FlgM [Acidobacteria bacterium]|nr:flagellar biosynthesis anti-sigma factor FlgM [Acidobacteriota bacterium]